MVALEYVVCNGAMDSVILRQSPNTLGIDLVRWIRVCGMHGIPHWQWGDTQRQEATGDMT